MGVWISRGNFISLLYKACAVSLYTILVRKIGGHFVTLFFNMSQNDLKLPNRILLIFSAIHIKSFAFRFATPSYYLMQYIEQEKVLHPHAMHQWKFIPEEWTVPAAKKDYQLLFGEEKK